MNLVKMGPFWFYYRFKVLHSNLTNTRDRKTFEAVAITIEKPKLNAQVFHRKVSIIYR